MKKSVIITGTGSGLGKELGKLLLNNNYNVIGLSRKNQITHPNFTFIKKDLSKKESIVKLNIPEIKLGHDIILINNAADIGEITTINKKSKHTIISEFTLNIITPTILSHHIIKKYPNHNKLIINISSGAANKPIGSWGIYCASKSALDMLTKVVANEKHKKLNIISIHPGIINTNMQKKIRTTDIEVFPLQAQFMNYYQKNMLEPADYIAKKIHYIIKNHTKFNENIISLRDVKLK